MSIAIFGTYSYWNDGIAWKDFAERGEDLLGVVYAAADRWFVHKERLIVEDAIGVDVEDVQELINTRYEQLIEAHQKNSRVGQLRTAIRHCEQWLENRDAETIRLTQQLAANKAELKELLND